MKRAEVREVWPRGGRIRIVGHVVGGEHDEHGRWALVLTARPERGKPLMRRLATRIVRGPAVRTYDTEVIDGTFEATFPVQALVAFPRWELYLRSADLRLPLGRHRDDVRNAKDVFVFPGQVARPTLRMALLRPRPGLSLRDRFTRGIRIKPQYTSDNRLIIGRPGGNEERAR